MSKFKHGWTNNTTYTTFSVLECSPFAPDSMGLSYWNGRKSTWSQTIIAAFDHSCSNSQVRSATPLCDQTSGCVLQPEKLSCSLNWRWPGKRAWGLLTTGSVQSTLAWWQSAVKVDGLQKLYHAEVGERGIEGVSTSHLLKDLCMQRARFHRAMRDRAEEAKKASFQLW